MSGIFLYGFPRDAADIGGEVGKPTRDFGVLPGCQDKPSAGSLSSPVNGHRHSSVRRKRQKALGGIARGTAHLVSNHS